MFSFLKNHPFAIEAFFERSLVVTYAISKEQIRHLVPECLELDLHNERWAFVAVAMVKTKDLRPKGFPKVFGNDFFLIGYRVFVKFTNSNGKRTRGLYILGSATNKRRMEFFGNLFTHYNYTTTDIIEKEADGVIDVCSTTSGFSLRYAEGCDDDTPLPAGSPFVDWKEARRFAGPLPFTFTYQPEARSVLVIEGVRQNWKPSPVNVIDHSFSFFGGLDLSEVTLANAFVVHNVPYYWKKGRIEYWSK